ncbi:DoxX family protein [Achromobacter sp. Marseille-Q0513]|uniref:DoxX family protein n=1 Tax=Achromobacter sp. Marseille-Q0513 TaxID=2829161 RepID=UPI001B91292B|nr:DoxX family protein [Achromobacter sp. Marseille-Q0513]MBR8653938.1 DoxX family protein [Achromobacter sp. Marseille-Q0513]
MSTTVFAAQSSNAPTASRTASNRLGDGAELLGRIMLAALFALSGLGKISAYAATAGYMAAAGLPGALLPLAIIAEIGGGLALILGWKTRAVAVLLAGFTLLTGLLFHANLGDQMQMIMFMKNLAIAGAFLILAARGAGSYSLDARAAR